MKPQKRLKYKELMNINGIDTLSGYIQITPDKEDISRISDNLKQCNYKPKLDKTYLLINPNKNANADEKLITSFSEFKDKMNYILSQIGLNLNDLEVTRTDFCFNSANLESFEDYSKMHRLLILCLAIAFDFKNCYESYGLLDYKKLSVAIKKDSFEIENYDKGRESDYEDECCNRLEIRSKKMSESNIEEQFLEVWFDRFDVALDNFDRVQKECNDNLEKLYKEDIAKPKVDRKYLSLNAFLLQHQESIFTSKQMVDLLSRFDEVKDPSVKARKFKQYHHIEYFSKSDIKEIVKVLKQKLKDYFNS